jgi:hypothetical protein
LPIHGGSLEISTIASTDLMNDALVKTSQIAQTLAIVSLFSDHSLPLMIILADCAVTRILKWAAPLGDFAGPGGWNDLDMLEVGNGNMTLDEYSKALNTLSKV